MNFTKTRKIWSFIIVLFLILVGIGSYPLPPQKPIQFYERESGQLKTEKVAGEQWLVWLYNNPLGEATLWTIAKRKIVSSIYGNMMDKSSSTEKITPFVQDFDVDMSISVENKFTSFNDFFTRKLKDDARPIAGDSTIVVSPADGKVLAYSDISNSDFFIKGYRFNVSSYLDDENLAKKYQEGSLLIIRLAPPDYHRYHFPVSGNTSENIKLDGYYYSVNPIALRKMAEIFWLNKREYTVISNSIFGDVIMSEVGATMVGSMVQTFTDPKVEKGKEKGYFKFGGSTVVLLFEKDKLLIDEDLLRNTARGFETTVKMGEKIGESRQIKK